jgi:hypothetical protein
VQQVQRAGAGGLRPGAMDFKESATFRNAVK